MKWITESMKRSRKLKDHYSMRGTEIYINNQPPEHIDVEYVFDYITARVPKRLLDSVDVIYVGEFPEFEEREINAFYDSGAIFVTNEQDDEQDMIDDIVHEIAHAVEKFKYQPIAGHVTFKKGERSKLATIASQIL